MPTKEEFFDMKVKVLEDFDFQMVLSAMKTTKWTWYFPKKNRVPKLEELHKRANEILDSVIERSIEVSDGQASIQKDAGGLIATYYPKNYSNPIFANSLTLSFQLTQSIIGLDEIQAETSISKEQIFQHEVLGRVRRLEYAMEELLERMKEENTLILKLKDHLQETSSILENHES